MPSVDEAEAAAQVDLRAIVEELDGIRDLAAAASYRPKKERI